MIHRISAALGLIFVMQEASASYAENLCAAYESQMEVVFTWRENGIPIADARNMWDSEITRDLDRYQFLVAVTEKIYKSPKEGRKYISTKQFMKKCKQIVQGYEG